MTTSRGFTLIEVLVAMAMVGLGLAGIVQLEVVAGRSGASSTRVEVATAKVEEVSAALQLEDYGSPLLADTVASNDSALKASGYQLDDPLNADLDHCMGSAADWPAAIAAHCAEWDALPQVSAPPGNLPDGGQPLFFIGWDVEDAQFSGSGPHWSDGGSVGSEGKVVVARVIWRDPAMESFRSASAVGIVSNPAAH